MNHSSVANTAFNTVDQNNDWVELVLLPVMSTMLVVATLSTTTLLIASVASSMPLAHSRTLPARLAFHVLALMAMTVLAFGLIGAIHTLVLKL